MLYFFATIGLIFTVLFLAAAIVLAAWIFDIWRP